MHDVAFEVEDCRKTYEHAVHRKVKSIKEPTEIKDKHGSIIIATIQTYGDTVHSLIQRVDYDGPFLPGFSESPHTEPFNNLIPMPEFERIDHVVGNQPDMEMEPTAQWYEKMLDFHRFFCIDDTTLHTEYSALRTIVMTDFDEKVKIPINEPAPGKRKS